MKPKKTALITDLDNTLFDWVELWYESFSAMLESVIEISGISPEQLIPEIAAVHRNAIGIIGYSLFPSDTQLQ